MRLKRKKKLKVKKSVEATTEQRERKEIVSDEGAIDFAQSLLIGTYRDYINALRTVELLENEYKKAYRVIRRYDDYCAVEKEVKEILKKKPKNRKPKEKKIVKSFKHRKKPIEPTKEQEKVLNDYIQAKKDIYDCENFYKSGRFKNLTMNASIDPIDLINQFKKEAKIGLTKRELKVLELRKTMTYEEIGKKLNITRERVSQIEKVALRKINDKKGVEENEEDL